MQGVISKARFPIKCWAPVPSIESQAIDQLVNTASLPCIFKHVAVMPDVHLGKGATVGSVVATQRAVIPAAVGVDIGCGMMAVKTPFRALDLPDSLKEFRADIEWGVPVGRDEHKTQKHALRFDGRGFALLPDQVHDRLAKAIRQIGTLGGGNHFIEVCLDEDQAVWVMLHSGSRNIGKEIADVHIDKAKGIMRDYMIALPDPDLAYFVEGTPEFDAYWRDLQWAQAYAFTNRQVMMDAVLKVFVHRLTGDHTVPVARLIEVNCHHNYAEKEHHYGRNVIVTRKGAVRARVGDFGIIPGSMGTKSYIVKGLGNPESFCSCSHGAGRRLSRTQANKTFTPDDVALQTVGVECRKDSGIIDELPGAYKDIDLVMAHQSDLVEIVATLKQVLCVKG